MATVSLQYIQDTKQNTTEIRNVSRVERESDQREKTLRWLSPMDFEHDHSRFSNQWMPGTSQWILQDSVYLKWRTATDSANLPRFLWLAGGVGCGKTFMAHFCVETLVHDDAIVIRYFFNAKQERGSGRTELSLIRTLLFQLLVNPRIETSSCLDALHGLRALSGKSEAGSTKRLRDEFFRCLNGYSGPPIHVVVDAVDEANSNDRLKILGCLSRLVSRSDSIRVLITSRPEEDILDWYDKLSSSAASFAGLVSKIIFPAEATAQDIHMYINRRVTESRKLSSTSVAQDIIRTVWTRAEGMFLYVRLMLDELEAESTVLGVRNRLQRFPASLNEYYDTVFARIGESPESTRTLARDLLVWITSSHEPLHVDTVLLALQNQGPANKAFGPFQHMSDDDEFELLDPVKQLRSVCFPLLEITENSLVQVVHCSVTAYITSQGMVSQATKGPILLLTPPQANHCIAITCIYFLSSELPANEFMADEMRMEVDDQEKHSTSAGRTSLLRYATLHWTQHLADSNNVVQNMAPKLSETLQLQVWIREWVILRSQLDLAFKKFFCIDDTNIPSCLELATYFGVTSWATDILDRMKLAVSDSLPCQIAAKRGSLDILRQFREKMECLGRWSNESKPLLHQAARHGQLSIVRYLAQETDNNVNVVDQYGRSALMHACSCGHGEVVAELLQLGSDASSVSRSGHTAIENAAAAGDLQSLKNVLAATDDNAIRLSLLIASANGHVDIVRFLLSNPSVDPDQKDQNSWTPLHWASRNGHSDIVSLLLARNAIVDARDNFGRTPLNRAVQIGAVDISKALLQAGASPISRDSSKMSLVHHAAAGGFVEILGLLISENVDPNNGEFRQTLSRSTIGTRGRDMTPSGPPLHIAAEYGQAAAVSYLIDQGARVDELGPKEVTALHCAAIAGHETVVLILLHAHADPRIGYGDNFPLTVATINDHGGIVSLLSAASWSEKDRKKSWYRGSPVLSAIHAAAARNNVALLNLILEKAPISFNVREALNIKIFEEAFIRGHLPIAENLLQLGFNLSEPTDASRGYPTALGYAIKGRQMAMIKFLLALKVNAVDFRPTDIKSPQKSGYDYKFFCEQELTAFDRAALQGDLDVLELLAKRQEMPPDPEDPKTPWPFIIDKAKLMPRLRFFSEMRASSPERPRNGTISEDKFGGTDVVGESQGYLFAAIASNDLDALESQIMNGTDVNALDWAFETPLIRASRAENVDVVNRLLQAGADVNYRCLNGSTALSVASQACNTALISVLLHANASIEGISLANACHRWGKCDPDLIKILLEAGVDPNFKRPGEWGGPPVCEVLKNRHTKFVEAAFPLFLKAGVDLTVRDGSATLLHLAADRCNMFAIRTLLEQGVPVDPCDDEGRTPLHRAYCSISPDNEAAFMELYRHGARLDTVGEHRISLLHIASGAGALPMVKSLVEDHGLHVDIRDAKDRTPLMWAIMGDWHNSPVRHLLPRPHSQGRGIPKLDTDMVKFLVDCRANIHAHDFSGRSPLHWAAAMGRADIIALLLELSATVDPTDTDRRTPLHLAIKAGAIECVRTLLAAGANPNVLYFSQVEDRETQQPLRELELSLCAYHFAQRPPLHLATEEPDYRTLRQMTQILIEAGANIFARNAAGETVLHAAVKGGKVTVVEDLIWANNFGNDYLRIKDNAGKSARDYAEEMGHRVLIKLLAQAEEGNELNRVYSQRTVLG